MKSNDKEVSIRYMEREGIVEYFYEIMSNDEEMCIRCIKEGVL